jgi:murein L,D-transpeptidase YcbB/YkuD
MALPAPAAAQSPSSASTAVAPQATGANQSAGQSTAKCSSAKRSSAKLVSASRADTLADPHKTNAAAARATTPRATLLRATLLRATIAAGELPELRWPNFSGYRPQVESLYQHSGYSLAWIRDGRPTLQALQMASILEQADNQGLSAGDYDGARWRGRIKALETRHAPQDLARFDIALTVSAMRYVSDLWTGRTNPGHVEYGATISRKTFDLPTFVQLSLVEGIDLRAAIASIEPPLAQYRELKAALVRYIRLATEDDGQKLPMPRHVIFCGMTYEGVPRLIRLLRGVGDLPENVTISPDSRIYSAPLVEAVERFQKRHNLPAGGYLDRMTLNMLNVPLKARVDQLRLALEHYRWLNYDFPQPPIIINIPESRLYALKEDGTVGLSMTVDVGQEYTRTPVLDDYLRYLIFRPYWDVPLAIQRDEIVSNIQINRKYLSKAHFEVVTPQGAVLTGEKVSNEVLEHLRAGTLHVRQKPGSDNSMGLVKFVFPNRYSVYLHDTPTWENYFAHAGRDVSHGCIHLKEPDKLAAWVLRDSPGWTLERVQRAMREGQDDFRVDLPNPVPVLIVYVTAVVGESGEVFFYRDIYGYDAELHHAIAKSYAPH